MLAAGPMTSFATHATFQEWLLSIPILSPEDRPNLAAVTEETAWLDSTIELHAAFAFISWRGVPHVLACIPGNRKLKQIPIAGKQETSSGCP
jgi:hypothetical protein